MTFDQMVLRPAEPAEANTQPSAVQPPTVRSTTSLLAWCTLDITGSSLVCAACDVSWLSSTGDTCWVCDRPGSRVGDLRR